LRQNKKNNRKENANIFRECIEKQQVLKCVVDGEKMSALYFKKAAAEAQ